jgi:hypothetical protein
MLHWHYFFLSLLMLQWNYFVIQNNFNGSQELLFEVFFHAFGG